MHFAQWCDNQFADPRRLDWERSSRRRPTLPVEELLPYTLVESGCWLFQGRRTTGGYGQTSCRNDWGEQLAHRLAYLVWVGEIADGASVIRRCRERLCIRPDHLGLVGCAVVPVTAGWPEYLLDARRTECGAGHSLVGDNLITRRNGAWACRECQRRRQREYRRRRRARAREWAKA